jgi:uncharacterized protein YjiS (DUF1127 family)
MKPGLLEMKREAPACLPEQIDCAVTNLAVNFEHLKLPTAGPRQAIRPIKRSFFAVRQLLLASSRLVWTVWTHRMLVNELDDLTGADFRDLGISPKDAASSAWNEARRRAAERFN